jgi:hypothetical protein
VAALALLIALCSKAHVVEAGFWFDRVTFDLPVGDVEQIGGPIRPDEQSQIESVARAELEAAYAGLTRTASQIARASFTERSTGHSQDRSWQEHWDREN